MSDPTSAIWASDASKHPSLRRDGSIDWVRVPLTPLPEVIESNSAEAWAAWDRAMEPAGQDGGGE